MARYIVVLLANCSPLAWLRVETIRQVTHPRSVYNLALLVQILTKKPTTILLYLLRR